MNIDWEFFQKLKEEFFEIFSSAKFYELPLDGNGISYSNWEEVYNNMLERKSESFLDASTTSESHFFDIRESKLIKSISPLYWEKFFSQEDSDRIFLALKSSIPFEQRRWARNLFPRLTFSYNPVATNSADRAVSIPILEELISYIQINFSRRIHSVLCNLYRNRKDYSLAQYNDYEKPPIDVFTFTFGSTRSFLLIPDDISQNIQRFNLSHGDLLYFNSETYEKYKPMIPEIKRKRIVVDESIFIVLFAI